MTHNNVSAQVGKTHNNEIEGWKAREKGEKFYSQWLKNWTPFKAQLEKIEARDGDSMADWARDAELKSANVISNFKTGVSKSLRPETFQALAKARNLDIRLLLPGAENLTGAEIIPLYKGPELPKTTEINTPNGIEKQGSTGGIPQEGKMPIHASTLGPGKGWIMQPLARFYVDIPHEAAALANPRGLLVMSNEMAPVIQPGAILHLHPEKEPVFPNLIVLWLSSHPDEWIAREFVSKDTEGSITVNLYGPGRLEPQQTTYSSDEVADKAVVHKE